MLYDVLITTPLFYSSGEPHIGHAYTLIIGDLIKKYYALIGKKAYLLSGVDEHGEKIWQRAKEANKSPSEFVVTTSQKFKNLWKTLDINPDCFVQTTNEDHKTFVVKLFNSLLQSKDIYLSEWVGYNCISCETNYSEQYYSNNKCCELGHKLQSRTEDAYFLNVKNHSDWLSAHYKNSQIITPDHYLKNLTQNFLTKLEDLSITRKNLDWGIKCQNSAYTIYVWFEALICYFSNHEIKKMWKTDSKTKIVQVLGKEIIRFHSIYLPIILKTQQLKFPEKLLVHGWLLNNDRKISKSEMQTNPVIPLNEITETLSIESIKWYFIFLNWFDDHSFSVNCVKQLFNKYMVHLFGNLVNRLKGILSKNNNTTSFIDYDIQKGEILDEIQKGTELVQELENLINEFQFSTIIQRVINLLESANKMIDKIEPWKLPTESKSYKELNIYLYRQLILAAWLLSPIFSSEKWNQIKTTLSIPKDCDTGINMEYLNSINNFSGVELPPITNLFQKYL